MQKVIYKNKFYIITTTLIIAFLLVKNSIKLMVSLDMMAAFILTVQAVVLYQIFSKNIYVKLGIKTWAILPIIKEGMMVGIAFLYFISGGSEFINLSDTFLSTFLFFAGILIFVFCERSIDLVKEPYV